MAQNPKRETSNKSGEPVGQAKSTNRTHAARLPTVIICGLLLTGFGITGRLAWNGKSATVDEPLHLVGAWAQTHLGDFRVNPEDPVLWKYYVAIGTDAQAMPLDHNSPDWSNLLDDMKYQPAFWSKSLYGTAGTQADELIQSGRTRMIFLGVGLGALIAWWAWRLGGFVAAIVATAAYSFDPNFLAHSPLIKNDVPMTLVFLGLMAVVWLTGESATLWRCVGLGLMLGAALTTKFSGVLAIPILAIALLLRAMLPDSWTILGNSIMTRRRRIAAALGILIAASVIAWGMIWACYGFRFAPGRNTDEVFNVENFVQGAMAGETAAKNLGSDSQAADSSTQEAPVEPGFMTQAITWCNFLHLAPQSWLMGFMYTWATTRVRRTFLLGKINELGHWYYFPIAALAKTPLATLIAFAVSAASLSLWAWRRRRNMSASLAGRIWPFLAVAIFPVSYFLFSLGSHLNIGIRHLLPVYPFIFIFMGVTASAGFRRHAKSTIIAIALLGIGLAAETFANFPNYIPFFNIAAGGSHGGEHILSDSNIDWGQELIELADWQRKNPEPQLYLYYFGPADPKYYHIHYVSLPGNESSGENPDPSRQAVYAISAVGLQGTYFLKAESAAYDQFRHEEPFAIIGGSIYLFHGAPQPATRGAD